MAYYPIQTSEDLSNTLNILTGHVSTSLNNLAFYVFDKYNVTQIGILTFDNNTKGYIIFPSMQQPYNYEKSMAEIIIEHEVISLHNLMDAGTLNLIPIKVLEDLDDHTERWDIPESSDGSMTYPLSAGGTASIRPGDDINSVVLITNEKPITIEEAIKDLNNLMSDTADAIKETIGTPVDYTYLYADTNNSYESLLKKLPGTRLTDDIRGCIRVESPNNPIPYLVKYSYYWSNYYVYGVLKDSDAKIILDGCVQLFRHVMTHYNMDDYPDERRVYLIFEYIETATDEYYKTLKDSYIYIYRSDSARYTYDNNDYWLDPTYLYQARYKLERSASNFNTIEVTESIINPNGLGTAYAPVRDNTVYRVYGYLASNQNNHQYDLIRKKSTIKPIEFANTINCVYPVSKNSVEKVFKDIADAIRSKMPTTKTIETHDEINDLFLEKTGYGTHIYSPGQSNTALEGVFYLDNTTYYDILYVGDSTGSIYNRYIILLWFAKGSKTRPSDDPSNGITIEQDIGTKYVTIVNNAAYRNVYYQYYKISDYNGETAWGPTTATAKIIYQTSANSNYSKKLETRLQFVNSIEDDLFSNIIETKKTLIAAKDFPTVIKEKL